MATQEERLQAVNTKLANIQTGVDRIQAELEAFKAGNPQLEDELAGLEAAVGALHDDVNPPAPTPEEPPA
jgi:septal ring factor EnvC (AmiA/AmiB activator)